MSTANDTKSGPDPATEAVRSYLLWLGDPSSLVDSATIAKLAARLDSASSPLDRLQIANALHVAESIDEDSLTGDFVRYAAEYAKREGIAPPAFLRLGVPEDVARAAGLLPTARKKSTPPVKKEKARAPRTGREQVIASIPERAFTYRELEEQSGASTVTVRKVVEDLISSGSIADIGPDLEYSGRGRAPRRFRPVHLAAPVSAALAEKSAKKPAAPNRSAAKQSGRISKQAPKASAKKR